MKTRVAKRSIAGALIIAMLVMMMLPMSVMAASNEKVKVLKPGQLATESMRVDKKENSHYVYYKITLKKDGRLTFKLSKNGYATLYENLQDCKSDYYDYADSWEKTISNNDMVAVDKGTYYLYVGSHEDVGKTKCKYTFTASSPTNYSIVKARTLKANKKVYNVFTPRTNFMRWFKVTTPKKKKIVFWSNYPKDIVVLNSKLQRIPTIAYGASVRYCTKKVLPKGTYYIGVKGWEYYDYDDEPDWYGYVTSLRWK